MLPVRARVRVAVGVRLIKKFVKELNKVIHQLKVLAKHLSRLVRNPRKSSQKLLLIHFVYKFNQSFKPFQKLLINMKVELVKCFQLDQKYL